MCKVSAVNMCYCCNKNITNVKKCDFYLQQINKAVVLREPRN